MEEQARLLALEHMVVTLWSCFVFNQADALGVDATTAARGFKQGVEGALADASLPAELGNLVRRRVGAMMGDVVANARNQDELRGKA